MFCSSEIMEIISHRGFWRTAEEKNTVQAFERALNSGFGIETDVRDLNGELVISHDLPRSSETILSFRNFLELYKKLGAPVTLALNIKADGLQKPISQALSDAGITQCFIFDMSIPDTLGYLKGNQPVFTRQSEFEIVPAFYERAKGVWLDCFEGIWFSQKLVEDHLGHGKEVCIVSPELHHRDNGEFWTELKKWPFLSDSRLKLCTDHPDEAKEWFA